MSYYEILGVSPQAEDISSALPIEPSHSAITLTNRWIKKWP